MTMNEQTIWIAYVLASRTLEKVGLRDAAESDYALFLESHPVLCTGEAAFVHACYHRERSKMRRQAQKRHGRLTRPQERRWAETQTTFQWLWNCGVIDAITIAAHDGNHCYKCAEQRTCQFAPYYLGR